MRDHDRDRDFSRELGEETKRLAQQVKGTPTDAMNSDRDWSEGSDVTDSSLVRDDDDTDKVGGSRSDRGSSGGKGRGGY